MTSYIGTLVRVLGGAGDREVLRSAETRTTGAALLAMVSRYMYQQKKLMQEAVEEISAIITKRMADWSEQEAEKYLRSLGDRLGAEISDEVIHLDQEFNAINMALSGGIWPPSAHPATCTARLSGSPRRSPGSCPATGRGNQRWRGRLPQRGRRHRRHGRIVLAAHRRARHHFEPGLFAEHPPSAAPSTPSSRPHRVPIPAHTFTHTTPPQRAPRPHHRTRVRPSDDLVSHGHQAPPSSVSSQAKRYEYGLLGAVAPRTHITSL
jgi:hypothetical protein